MAFKILKSFAKINLALNVIKKTSYLHKIESLIAFIDLNDLIYIKKIN
jgi:4-diphosphocytidyl-2-C-methyl-D-erythritol kinase